MEEYNVNFWGLDVQMRHANSGSLYLILESNLNI